MLFHKNKCIMVADCGLLGATLTKSLYEKDHKATVLDEDRENFRYLPEEFKGCEMEGDPTDPQVLKAAGTENAGLFITSTQNDDTNLLLAQIASHTFHASQAYARLDDIGRHQLVTDLPVKPISLYDLPTDDYGRLAETVSREVAVRA